MEPSHCQKCVGVVDTVRFKGRGVIDSRDEAGLRARGFKERRNICVEVREGGETADIRTMWHDESTGARVMLGNWDGQTASIAVEASVPRMLGLGNDEQESVTDGDLQEALWRMTGGLLPFTEPAMAEPFGVNRIDLARNFEGKVPFVIRAYADRRHPEVRRPTKVFFEQSVAYYGTERELIVYDKGLQMGGEAGRLGRVESRWVGRKGVQRLWAWLEEERGCAMSLGRPEGGLVLPFRLKLDRTPGRRPFLAYVSLENGGLLDAALRSDVASLGRVADVPRFQTLTEVALDALTEFPDRYGWYWAGVSTKQRWRTRRMLRAYQRGHEVVDLLELIWSESEAVA